MTGVDRVAFAIPLRADRVQDVEELARAATSDASLIDLSRELGLQRSMAWIQDDDPPILTVYMEWKVDPVDGLHGYEMSPKNMADQIRTVLRAAASSPGDAALDEAASRSEVLFDWTCSDGARGRDVRCYGRAVPPETAANAREFLSDLGDPAMRRLYGRLRERVGMKRVTIWAEPMTDGDAVLIELYESDDLDRSFDLLDKSAYELDEMTAVRTALTFGWGPGQMPALRSIYDWGAVDAE